MKEACCECGTCPSNISHSQVFCEGHYYLRPKKIKRIKRCESKEWFDVTRGDQQVRCVLEKGHKFQHRGILKW